MLSDFENVREVSIGSRKIGPGHPVFIVAELSANHRQDFNEAVRLIEAAKKAGADAVKLQTYTPDTMTIDCGDERFRHGHGSLWKDQTLYELYQKAYMPWDWQPKLKKKANELGLELFSSVYDSSSVVFLESMNVPAYKISSFELIDLPLIRQSAKTGKPLILSTGMATLVEIQQAVDAARSAAAKGIVLLKCTSAYPADVDEMNLITIPHLSRTFNLPCGLSDHSRETAAAVVAVSLGACLLEKHFTLKKDKKSIDGAFSLTPDKFGEMVNSVRIAEKAIGKVAYGPQIPEQESLTFRRSLYAVEDIPAGGQIAECNVRPIRPAGGSPPSDLPDLIGKITKQALKKGTPITREVCHT
jgi:N-acetylneuraminate synthase